MKDNLILLASERSNILLLKDGTLQLNSRTWTREELSKASISNAGIIPKDIYKISDDKPEDGDWCINKMYEIIQFQKRYNQSSYRKITHTTNQDLIFRHDIPELDSQCVEQFISNYNQEP